MPADSFESPLTLAACGGHVELALLLIERGANLEEVNDEGYTPLMEAAREGHEEMVALLLAHGNMIGILWILCGRNWLKDSLTPEEGRFVEFLVENMHIGYSLESIWNGSKYPQHNPTWKCRQLSVNEYMLNERIMS